MFFGRSLYAVAYHYQAARDSPLRSSPLTFYAKIRLEHDIVHANSKLVMNMKNKYMPGVLFLNSKKAKLGVKIKIFKENI